MRTRITTLPMLIGMVLLAGCGSGTKVIQSWHDPNVTVADGSYNKVLVIGLIKDESTRRIAEDRMVKFMNGHGVTSYTYLGPDVEQINAAGMNDRMITDGIDGVLIMRLVDKKQEQTYVPGTVYPSYYGSHYGYYGYAYPMYSSPGYVRTDEIYYVETNLYMTKREGLVWTSTTSSFNPTNLGSTVDGIMEEVYWRMKKDGFIVAAPK